MKLLKKYTMVDSIFFLVILSLYFFRRIICKKILNFLLRRLLKKLTLIKVYQKNIDHKEYDQYIDAMITTIAINKSLVDKSGFAYENK